MHVQILNIETSKIKPLYEFIETPNEAQLLAQYAMKNKSDNELVIIFPGFNCALTEDELINATELAEKYKLEI